MHREIWEYTSTAFEAHTRSVTTIFTACSVHLFNGRTALLCVFPLYLHALLMFSARTATARRVACYAPAPLLLHAPPFVLTVDIDRDRCAPYLLLFFVRIVKI